MVRFVRTFAGVNNSGGIVSVPDVRIGDRVESVQVNYPDANFGLDFTGGSVAKIFATFVMVDGELVQIPGTGDYSSYTLHVLFSREVVIP
jgi:hypothetical protein